MAVITIERTAKLDAPISPEKLQGSLFTSENNAHKFLIACERGGEPEPVTGTVTARFMRRDGSTIFLTGGEEDGKAAVVLSADCYNIAGAFRLTVSTTEGGSTLAIYSAVGDIVKAQEGELLDGSGAIPKSVDDIAAALEGLVPGIMTGATPMQAGVAGLVPAPNALANMYYLRGDGTWDDLRTMILNIYPTAQAPMTDGVAGYADGPTGVPLPGNAAQGVPFKTISVYLLSGPGITYDSITLDFTFMGFFSYGTVTIDFVALTGQAYSGAYPVQIDPAGNRVTIGGIGYDVSLGVPNQVSSMTIKCTQADSTLQIFYRVDPTSAINALDARVAALENA